MIKFTCDEIKTMQDLAAFMQTISGRNVLLHSKYNVKMTHDIMELPDERVIILIDEFFTVGLDENKEFLVFDTSSFRPLLNDCKQLVTVMVRWDKKVIFL